MKKHLQSQSNEPVGIIISRGSDVPKAPRFSAYVWAPAPDDEVETPEQAA